MLFRIVNWFFLVLCFKVCTLQGENAFVHEKDYLELKKFSDTQIPILKKDRVERHVPIRPFIRRFDRSADQDSGVQEELSEFFVGNIKCTRYCVEKKSTKVSEEGTYRLLNLVWTFASGENETVNISTPITDNVLIPEVMQKNISTSENATSTKKKCELYLVVACDLPKNKESSLNKQVKKFIQDLYPSFKDFTNTSRKSDKSQEILVEEKNLTNSTETRFYVKTSVEKLSIVILGNISKVDVEIPTDNEETPLEPNETIETPDMMLSLTRMTETMGVRLNTRNPPSGGWNLKLTPVEGSNYHFIIATTFSDSKTGDNDDLDLHKSIKTEPRKEEFSEKGHIEKVVENEMSHDSISDGKDGNETIRETPEKTSDSLRSEGILYENIAETRISGISMLPKLSFTSENRNLSSNELSSVHFDPNNSENLQQPPQHWQISGDTNEKPSHVMFLSGKNIKFAQLTNLNSKIDDSEVEYIGAENNPKPFTTMMRNSEIDAKKYRESSDLQDFTRDPTDSFFQKKSVTIDVNPESNLVVRSGAGKVRLFFDVRNNQMLTLRVCYRATSSVLRPLELIPLNPIEKYCNAVSPGQMVQVFVDLIVPSDISDTVNTVTLTAQVYGFNTYNTVEKSAYLYIQSSNLKTIDDTKPTVYYYFNNNCGGRLRDDRCSKNIWSVDITVHDADSGLKLVTSSPYGLIPRTEYTSGTTNPVTFYYYATCCHRSVDISAVDMYGNYNKRTIDVTEWNNLSEGEIAAAVVGALFIILLIVLIIMIVAYCVNRRKSRDLPYTQRYGSRPPAQRPERTSF